MKKVYVDGSTTQTASVIDEVVRVLPVGRVGTKVTNNQGEYLAIIEGMWRAIRMGLREIEILSDSQLAVKQLNGEYQIKNSKLEGLALTVERLVLERFDAVKFTWIPREENPAGEVLG